MKKDSLEARYEQIIESTQRMLGENLKLTDDQYLAAALKNPVNSGKLAAQAIKFMIDRKELKPNWKLIDNEIKLIAVKLKFDTNSKGNLDDYNTFIQSAHSTLKSLGVKLKDSPPENRKFNFSSSDYSSRSSSRNSEILPFKNNDSIHDTNIQSMLGL